MKHYLLGAALLATAFAATPAKAEIAVEIGGLTSTYFGFATQDEAAGNSVNNFDILRESELHFNAEATTDSGLTYGLHIEMEADGGDDTNTLEQSYLYLSNQYGKLEVGSVDSVSYKMQVAAPTADKNIDGVRQLINPVSYAADDIVGAVNDIAATGNADGFDYDQNFAGYNEKINYYTPKWDGLQVALGYTPDNGDNNSSTGLDGFNLDNVANAYGSVYDAAIRYENEFGNVKYKVGAGYTHGDLEADGGTGLDDYQEWNVGIDFDIGAFGVGAVYSTNNNGLDSDDSDNILVLGADYKTGKYTFGVSYYDRDDDAAGTSRTDTSSVKTKRYVGGVTYKIVDGLDVRGSVGFIENDVPAAAGSDTEATFGLVGFNLTF